MHFVILPLFEKPLYKNVCISKTNVFDIKIVNPQASAWKHIIEPSNIFVFRYKINTFYPSKGHIDLHIYQRTGAYKYFTLYINENKSRLIQ